MDASAAKAPQQLTAPSQEDSHVLSAKRTQHSRAPASCTLCRRRKIKCDRTFPCGNCARGGVECVPSIPSHAPRGRRGGRKRNVDGELLERIARLEGLVQNVSGDSAKHGMRPRRTNSSSLVPEREGSSASVVSDDHDPSQEGSIGTSSYRNHVSGLGLDRYLGSSLWMTLSDEVKGLQDILNGLSDGEDEAEEAQTPPSRLPSSVRYQQQQRSDSRFIISPRSPVETPGTPTAHQLYTFCEIYLNNVDPVYKILHAPSLRKYLQDGAAELDCSPGVKGLEALKFAICYAAIVSMTDEECRHRIGERRADMMTTYRLGTELSLAKADFVNTTEMSTLQALTIYLALVRVHDTQRLMWTLTSLAVRIAQAMCLHHESYSPSRRPFMREMRRRLWWQICLLDSHAAEDRATNPVIYGDSFNTSLPLRLNDEDLHLASSEEIGERHGFTDMTFCLVCQELMDTIRQLNFVPIRKLGEPEDGSQERVARRIDAAISVQRRIEERHLRHLNLARPFQWATRKVADIVTAVMWLVVYRPLQKRPDTSPSPHLADPGVLGLSVEVLERSHQLYTDPAASSFRWLSETYVQWHALAVAIAELCVKFEGPMIERAWAIVIPAFTQASQHVADSSEGMLWRPIKKLMNRAQGLRQEYLDSQLANANLPTNVADWRSSAEGNNQAKVKDSAIFDVKQSTQEAAESSTPPIGVHLAPSVADPAAFDWDPWLAAASTSIQLSLPNQYNDNMNQMAWTNWENFINDFQGQEEL